MTTRMRRTDVLRAGLALPALAASACGAAGGGTGDAAKNALPQKPVDVQLWARGPSEEAVKALSLIHI